MRLDVQNLSFAYKSRNILDNVHFDMKSGELLGLLGPNGAGKTTLLKCLNNIQSPQKGKIMIDGKDILHLSTSKRSSFFSYVPQNTNHYFPIIVFDAILLGRIKHIKLKPKEEDKDKVIEIIKKLHLTNLAFKKITQLSGGELQRVFIARAIVQDTPIILLDEPTSNLDISYQLETMELMHELAKKKNKMIILSMHDLNLASMYTDKVIILSTEEPPYFGTTHETMNASLIKKVYKVDVIVKDLAGTNRILIQKPSP